jgi:5-deoxy-D-glucuronate isomerase
MCMLVKPQADQTGGILRTVDITPKTAAWHSISFSVDHRSRGQALHHTADGRETTPVMLYRSSSDKLNSQMIGRVEECLSVFEEKLPFTSECDLYYLNVIADPHGVGNYQVDPAFHRQLPLPPSDKITGSIVCPSAKAK